MPLPNPTAYLDLRFLNIVFSLSADWSMSAILCVPSTTLYCVYHHLVVKHVTHLMFALACIFKKSVILLLSQYYFHWAFALSERKIYTCLLTHFILACFLSKGFFWGVFLEWVLF